MRTRVTEGFLFFILYILGMPAFTAYIAPHSLGGSCAAQAPALPSSPYIRDFNKNGVLEVVAFGDSITRGVGDQPANEDGVFEPFQPREEAGYPLRLEQELGFNVSNQGVPGEFLTREGVPRFIQLVSQTPPDTIILSGGSNDSREGVNPNFYFHSVQKLLNVARVHGVQVVLLTPPPSCCNHEPFAPLVNGYIDQMRQLAATNDLPIADVAHAFRNSCDLEECSLLNLPEGLHPNDVGYDVFAEVVLATLFQFDIFSALGQQEFEHALGLPAGSVITLPDAVPTPTPTPTPNRPNQ